MKKIDCAWDDGIPGSDLKVETGRSWFSILLSTIESIQFRRDPIEAHKTSESCLQRMIPPKRATTSHLLCKQQQLRCQVNILLPRYAKPSPQKLHERKMWYLHIHNNIHICSRVWGKLCLISLLSAHHTSLHSRNLVLLLRIFEILIVSIYFFFYWYQMVENKVLTNSRGVQALGYEFPASALA